MQGGAHAVLTLLMLRGVVLYWLTVGRCGIGALHAVGHGDGVSSDLVNHGVSLASAANVVVTVRITMLASDADRELTVLVIKCMEFSIKQISI